MADLSVLEHEHADVPSTTIADYLEGLPNETAELLGYRLLLERKEKTDFQRTLAELGVRPFTKKSVERYKAEAAREANNSRPRLPRVVNTVARVGLLLSMIGVVISFFTPVLALSAVPFFVISLGGMFACGLISLVYQPFITEWGWTTTELEFYRVPVPEFALQRAIEIKKRFPDAKFSIHHLGAQIRDPFLVVRWGGGEYFIAVWNEPGFDAQEEI